MKSSRKKALHRSRSHALTVNVIEQLEARDLCASLNDIGTQISKSLKQFAQGNVIAPSLQALPHTVQSSIVTEASDNCEAAIDTAFKLGADYGNLMAQSGLLPKLPQGWLYKDMHTQASGLVGEIGFDGTAKYSDVATVNDNQSGFSIFDTTFSGVLSGTAQVSSNLHVHMILDVNASKDGSLSAKLSSGTMVALENLNGITDLKSRGAGAFGADADVTIASHGAFTGSVIMNIDNNNGGIKAEPLIDLSCSLKSVLISNETFSAGVSWTIDSASRETGRGDINVAAPVYHSPSALSVLQASYKGIGTYRFQLPDGINDAVSGALSLKVPFTNSKSIGQVIGYPSRVPLLVDTINPDRYSTYSALATAISNDNHFVVQLGGQAGADAFARGVYTPVLDVTHVKGAIGTSFTLAQTPLGTYVIYPGITLSGTAGIYVDINASVDAGVRVDSHGAGFREGTNVSFEIKLEGALSGALDVLQISKHWSLVEGDVKAGAYVDGSITATLGSPFDKMGNITGYGIFYVGAAASLFNPKSAVGDYVRLDLGLDAGVEISAKVKIPVLGVTVWKKSWSTEWPLAHATYQPKKRF